MKWAPNLIKKIYQSDDVLCAARSRLEWAFDTFPRVCVSFSGGKDSTVLFHLTAAVAKERKRTFSVLFIDWEVQFQLTIEHIQWMKERYAAVTEQFYWVALPMTTVSGVSQLQPEWTAWDKNVSHVRQPPADAITDENYFPFYRNAMTFEEFVPAFSAWLSEGKGLVTLTGVRADESLTRLKALVSNRKLRYADDKPWTTVSRTGNYCIGTPLYDWKVTDIWTYHTVSKARYNQLYDLMYRAGVPLKLMRICEPFGPEQRQGLWLYHVLEPDTWSRVCNRVAGACSGASYGNHSGPFYSRYVNLSKPSHLTWQAYAHFLLNSMPHGTAEHYRTKIAVYLKWYRSHGYIDNIPEEQDKDLGARDIPSWRRICKTLIKNDYWCKTLSFSPTRANNYAHYMLRMKTKREEWGTM